MRESRGNYATILGTQKLHWVSSCNVDGQLKVRNLSCYCLYCIVKNYQQCINSAYVNVPKLVTFSPDVPSSSTAEPQNQNEDNEGDKSEDVPETVSMASLAAKGSIVAVRPNVESVYDYFLFKVESSGIQTLSLNTADENGLPFAAGSEVLDGFFYEVVKESRKGSFYKLSKKQSFVHKDTVLCVGIELKELQNGTWCLDPIDHSEILQTVFS